MVAALSEQVGPLAGLASTRPLTLGEFRAISHCAGLLPARDVAVFFSVRIRRAQ
jgi:hypothetical protein